MLEGIESRLRSPKAEQPDVPKNLTIEHLMPLSWEANWALSDGVDEEPAREYRNRIVHTIGNLTLVNQKLNSSLSNAPWEEKRESLLEHSVMTLNSELRNECSWNEETIRTRSRRMAELIADCWPGPSLKRLDLVCSSSSTFEPLPSDDTPAKRQAAVRVLIRKAIGFCPKTLTDNGQPPPCSCVRALTDISTFNCAIPSPCIPRRSHSKDLTWTH